MSAYRAIIILASLVLPALLLAGCSAIPTREPIVPSRTIETMTVTIHQMSQDAVSAFCADEGLPRRRACTIAYPQEHRCDMYVPSVHFLDDPETETVGHEVLHCFYGRYHKEN